MATTDSMRLIRRVQGRRGSVCLYEHRYGLAEVVEVNEGGTQVIELRRHGAELRDQLLGYLDDVQSAVQLERQGARPAKKTHRILGQVWRPKASGGANG